MLATLGDSLGSLLGAVNFKDMISADAFELFKRIAIAVGLFVGGLLVAKFVARLVERGLNATTWDDKIASKLGYDPNASKGKLERVVGQIVFWLLMGLVIVAVLDYAGLSQAAVPLQAVIASFMAALPAIGKAVIILLVAWVLATAARKLLTQLLDRSGVDARYAKLAEGDDAEATAENPLSTSVGQIAFWLILFVGLTGALDALQLGAVVTPLRNVLDGILGALPALAMAAVILLVGYVAGKITRTVLSNLLASVGLDKLTSRLKLEKVFEKRAASAVVGLLVFAFIMLQAIIAALGQLGLDTLSEPLAQMMGQFWNLLPSAFTAAVLIAVAVVVGRIVRDLVTSVLESIGFDRLLHKLGLGELETKSEKLKQPSALVGELVALAILLVAIVQALSTLGLGSWAYYLETLLAYAVQNVLPAFVIVAIGLWLGNVVRELIAATGGDDDRTWLAAIGRWAVLVFAFTMALYQLDVAQTFVTTAFALLFGALCLALALSFGLGGREVAGEIVRERYDRAKKKGDKND